MASMGDSVQGRRSGKGDLYREQMSATADVLVSGRDEDLDDAQTVASVEEEKGSPSVQGSIGSLRDSLAEVASLIVSLRKQLDPATLREAKLKELINELKREIGQEQLLR